MTMEEAIRSGEIKTIYDYPDEVTYKWLTADGYKTHYVEAGDENAPALVLVHGGAMSVGLGFDRWYPTIIPLAEHFRVFAVDEIGAGESDAPRDMQLTFARIRAEHVIAFIEELDVAPVYLVGQSTGGWIATYITIKRPDLVKKLVMVDSGSVAGSGFKKDGDTPHLAYFDKVFKPGTMEPKLDLTSPEGVRSHMATYVYDESPLIDQYMARINELAQKWNPHYVEFDRQYWQDVDTGWKKKFDSFTVDGVHISEKLHTIDTETLIVWGRDSNKGFDAGVAVYKQVPNAEFHVFDKANHFLWLDRPIEFNGLVTQFLTRSGRGRF